MQAWAELADPEHNMFQGHCFELLCRHLAAQHAEVEARHLHGWIPWSSASPCTSCTVCCTVQLRDMDALPCRYLVSQNPEVEAKILAELDGLELSITPQRPHPRRMTYADMNRLTYLQATIKVPLLSSFPLHQDMIPSRCPYSPLSHSIEI